MAWFTVNLIDSNKGTFKYGCYHEKGTMRIHLGIGDRKDAVCSGSQKLFSCGSS
ncbi:MAG: hypothetical protein AB4063_11375 [Crocosphaera sp.]